MDGSSLLAPPSHRRRSLRRAVQIEAEVTSALWDGSVPLLATDLSLHGLWLESELPLHPGEQLSVSFLLPQMAVTNPFHARARVARVGLLRRRTDAGRPGMGVCFVDLRADQSERLAYSLLGLPPPLPQRSAADERAYRLTSLTLADGLSVTFRAEAPLLTADRTSLLPRPPLSSAMSSILRVRRQA